MKAKFIYEAMEDILKPKSEEEISRDFKKEYGINYYSPKETVKRLNSLGVKIDSRVSSTSMVLQGFRITETRGGMGWVIGTAPTLKYAEHIATTLKNYLHFWDDSKIYEIKEGESVYITHHEALEILNRLENES
jgi:hypothetical protein